MLELLTCAEMAAADGRTIAGGTPGIVLMERAGQAVAERVLARAAGPRRIAVLCGPGNNGGDGFVVARLLAAAGHDVAVHALVPPDRLTGDAAEAARGWEGEILPLAGWRADGVDIVVDAMFGAGLARDIAAPLDAVIAAVNAAGAHVVAVDVPSGIDGDTGAVRGCAIQADETVTFARRKPGHLLMPGRGHCGPVHVADIGITDATVAGLDVRTAANAPGLWRGELPRPDAAGHKYKRGHLVVASGGPARTGAARLAARAGLRAGAGLVTVASPPSAVAVNAAQLTAVMVRAVDGAEGLADLLSDARFSALVLGPALGIGEETRRMVEVAAAARRHLVLDADALTSFSNNLAGLWQVVTSAAPAGIVLTPHEGEFARLFGEAEGVAQARSKLERARAAAAASGAVVVLKGPDTVIAAPDGRAAINENAPPWLATAGTGDVLAGIIGGLMAQEMPAFAAACAGVWMHGAAATAFGPGLIAEDLPEMLPQVWRTLLD
ncbi:hydroxyethylthiazole kinase-like uncharacterized protein yjeF [Chelatococcus caeni]|uniref:Bifunctional NAD(P)H-hydrate repair enzyme n=1 Tax=Chelatococcus caeni TaxID=1348468 RepID=A0A840BXB1_9HYPH|nr:NAD(P)H-hydrate dehydratase [Chelatococcus caeni]MBB4016098.1 hydroxyethylthiazole kinase-like uncharacterized protein yjeF [Chelatococcus caeni]